MKDAVAPYVTCMYVRTTHAHTCAHTHTHTHTHTHNSNWPTFPQVYINGELLGGSDIMLQLHQNGELISELEKIGHQSLLLDQ